MNSPDILKNQKIALIILVGLTLLTMIRFDRPLVRGDGVAYLAWTDSVALDHDFNLENQFEKLSVVNTYQIIVNWHNGRYVNGFPFGVAFLQYPFYKLGHLFLQLNWLNLNPDYFHQMQGVPLPYSFWAMVGANLMGLTAVVLAWFTARRLTSPWMATVVAWAVYFGSPLFYYTTVSPLNSHSAGAVCAAVFLFLALRGTGGLTREASRPRETRPLLWLGVGVSAGLMTLSRWQLLLVAVPVWALMTWRREWRGLLYATPAAALTLLPLPLVWNYLFDTPFTIPYDITSSGSFLHPPIHAGHVLAFTLYNSPILTLSIAGLIPLWRRNRPWTLVFGTIILLQVLINGAALDWWAGESFGMRRMSELYFVYAVLVAATIGYLPKSPRRRAAILLRGLLLLLVLYNILFVFSFFSYRWTNLEYTPIPTPKLMIEHFLGQQNRWEVIETIFRTHLGPPAWSKPGP
jgi:hypothetical protein